MLIDCFTLSGPASRQRRSPQAVETLALALTCIKVASSRCGPLFIDEDPTIFLKLVTQLTTSLADLVRHMRKRPGCSPYAWVQVAHPALLTSVCAWLVPSELGGLLQIGGVVDGGESGPGGPPSPLRVPVRAGRGDGLGDVIYVR